MRVFVGSALLALTCAAPAAAQLPAPPVPWTPPVGIPAPPFGITNVAPAATMSVTCPAGTIPSTLNAGDVVEVQGSCAGRTITANGTAANPVFIRGINNASCTSGTMTFRGSYLIVEGFTFDTCRVVAGSGAAPVNFFALRRSIVRNYNPSSNSSALSPQGSNIVIFANEIHNNGNPNSATEVDIHGMKPDTGDSNIWFLDNHVHHNGGDAIQIGDAGSSEPWVHHVYVGRNTMHEDRENAVDIKRARDVIVSQNTAYGYRASSSSGGVAMVTHDNPDRVWLVNNVVHSSVEGLVCTGARNYYVIGNVLYNIKHPAGTSYDAGSLFAPAAIRTYSSTNTFHVGNTIWDVDAGISNSSGSGGTHVVNNIIGGLAQPSHHVGFGDSTIAGNSTFTNNLLAGAVRIRVGSAVQTTLGSCTGCLNADPGFANVSARDFRLTAGSPAVGAGVAHAAFTTFFNTYGLRLDRDAAGVTRPQGPWDIGAYEFNAAVPAPPTNFRVVGGAPD